VNSLPSTGTNHPPHILAHILLPTDFSANALHAAEYATLLCGAEGHTYTLLRAIANAADDGPDRSRDALRLARYDMRTFADLFIARTGATDVVQKVVHGMLPLVFTSVVDQVRADLVVMGKRGATGSALWGSNTTGVIERCQVPVLVVPEQATLKQVRRIVLADDRKGVTPSALGLLRQLAMINQATIMIVHVKGNNPNFDGQWSHDAYAEAFDGIEYEFHYAHDSDVQDGLVRFAEEHHVQLISVVHRATGWFGRLFKPSRAEALALKGDLPLLVLQE